MKLFALLEALPDAEISDASRLSEEVFSVCCDSRQATDGAIFVCVNGERVDGHRYAANAYRQGTRIFVIEHDLPNLPTDAVTIKVENSRVALACLSAAFYGYPAQKLTMIGITGTKGKTSTALMIRQVLCDAGIPTGYIGTNGVIYRDFRAETANSTPESLDLHYYMKQMARAGITVLVMEVSSQAIKMDRIYGIDFDLCLFTNFSPDHIGEHEHRDLDEYFECKHRLFTEHHAKTVIYNADDPRAEEMISGCENAEKISIGARENAENITYTAFDQTPCRIDGKFGMRFSCRCNEAFSGEDSEKLSVITNIELPQPGAYSVCNALMAFAVCRVLGVPAQKAVETLGRISVKGRFEMVTLKSRPDTLFVIDYAHNGVSLEAVGQAIRSYSPTRVICLLGSVGGRTQMRRPELGRAVSTFADVAVLTADNPDFENPEAIIDDIAESIDTTRCRVLGIADRAKAIEYVFRTAKPGDVILLAGKGHETYQLVRGEKVPFSERAILEACDRRAQAARRIVDSE